MFVFLSCNRSLLVIKNPSKSYPVLIEHSVSIIFHSSGGLVIIIQSKKCQRNKTKTNKQT